MSMSLPPERQPQLLRSSSTYQKPRRELLDPHDMSKWLDSSSYMEIVSFVEQLSHSVQGKKISSVGTVSPQVEGIVQLLKDAESWISKYPPDTSASSRFGSTSFRSWEAELQRQAEHMQLRLLPAECHDAAPELAPYLAAAFGNATRIDYGSGHELSFVMWLLCLCKIGMLKPSDSAAIVLVVFRRYIQLCQQLQRTYKLEPAGSHGVWGLDDYQFLPFYFGSAQFVGGSTTPAASLDSKLIDSEGDEYLYLQGIRFIGEMKRGPFFEHSRQLYDISGVPRWEKVNQGLGKMYKAEVLGKFPVVQHLLFGSLLSISK